MRRRLFWHLIASYLLITLLALLALTWGAWWALRQFYYAQTRADLEARAHLAAGLVAAHFHAGETALVDARCKETGGAAATRITAILPTGQVIGDSHHDVATMENHLGRPEVMRALAGEVGVSVRRSDTMHEDMMYLAVPVTDGSHVVGVVRTAIPLTAYDRALASLHTELALVYAAIAIIAALVSIVVSRRISQPLEEARQAAESFAQGDLQGRLPVTGSEETAGLAVAMNRMAAQLDERIRTIVRQRTEQEAVLASMIEGVLAVDNEEHLLKLNPAAGRLLGVDPAVAQGRSLQDTVRNTDLQRFMAQVLASSAPQEAEITLRHKGDLRHIEVQGTWLRDEHGQRIGALVVLNDVTRQRRLETVRRDFVANVSHELRTPITSIKGFVETLLDGALAEPEAASRFLQIIARHTDRLNAIIEDLLALSRLEQQGEDHAVALAPGRVWDVAQVAVETCAVKAANRHIEVVLQGDRAAMAPINPPLLEQALVNLIDNAIKYSPEESRTTVEVVRTTEATLIHVRDQGCGIPREHQPRIFERFYRVDTGRSRKLGGTGLGLAIVKHIIQAHQGSVTVESLPGSGSTFTLHLPTRG